MKLDLNAIPGELVTFHASDGIELQGFFVKSKKRTRKAVIHISGLTGNFHRGAAVKRMLPFYLDKGYDFLLINTRGSGVISRLYQVKDKKVKRKTIGTAFEKFEESERDLKGAIEFLKSRRYRKIILQGHSTGCQKATYYMYKTRDRRVAAIVLLAPADDYNVVDKKELGKRWMPTVRYAKEKVKKGPNELMPKKLVKNKIISVQRFLSVNDLSRVEARIFNYESGNFKEFRSMTLPVLAVFGTKEQHKTKPVSVYLKQLSKATRSKKFTAIEIEGGDHDFKPHEKEAAQKVVDWLDKVV